MIFIFYFIFFYYYFDILTLSFKNSSLCFFFYTFTYKSLNSFYVLYFFELNSYIAFFYFCIVSFIYCTYVVSSFSAFIISTFCLIFCGFSTDISEPFLWIALKNYIFFFLFPFISRVNSSISVSKLTVIFWNLYYLFFSSYSFLIFVCFAFAALYLINSYALMLSSWILFKDYFTVPPYVAISLFFSIKI